MPNPSCFLYVGSPATHDAKNITIAVEIIMIDSFFIDIGFLCFSSYEFIFTNLQINSLHDSQKQKKIEQVRDELTFIQDAMLMRASTILFPAVFTYTTAVWSIRCDGMNNPVY